MSWYSSSYKYRFPVAVDNLAGAAAGFDISFTIPKDLEEFWSTVLSTGYDIRVCTSDGATLAVFQRQSWTYATRTAVIECQNVSLAAASMCQIWLYWGYASASDGAGSFVAASPKTGYLFPAVPRTHIVRAQPERPGDTTPRNKVHKLSAEKVRIWWDFRGLLLTRGLPYNGSRLHEEIDSVILVDVQLATVSQATMIDTSKTRFLDGWVGTWVQAGTSGTTYTAICRIDTNLGRRLEARVLVYVRDVVE